MCSRSNVFIRSLLAKLFESVVVALPDAIALRAVFVAADEVVEKSMEASPCTCMLEFRSTAAAVVGSVWIVAHV